MGYRAILILLTAGMLAACAGTASPTSTPTSGGGGGSATVTPTAAPATQGSGSSGTGAAPSACALLAPADAAVALGQAVGEATVNQGGGDNCTYAPTVITGLTSVELSVMTPDSFTQVKDHVGSGLTLTPVSGLGDDAFYLDAGAMGTTLYVLRGTSSFSISIFNGSDSAAQIQAAEKVAAQTALGRL